MAAAAAMSRVAGRAKERGTPPCGWGCLWPRCGLIHTPAHAGRRRRVEAALECEGEPAFIGGERERKRQGETALIMDELSVEMLIAFRAGGGGVAGVSSAQEQLTKCTASLYALC